MSKHFGLSCEILAFCLVISYCVIYRNVVNTSTFHRHNSSAIACSNHPIFQVYQVDIITIEISF